MAPEAVSRSLSGGRSAASADRRKLRNGHADAGVTPVVVYGFVLRLSREVAWRVRCVGGNFGTATSCAGVTLVVAPGCVLQSSRGLRDGSGTLELAPGLPRTARIERLAPVWPGCVLRLLRDAQDGSKRWNHAPVAATLRATISRSQPTYEPVFLGRSVTTLRMTPVCVPGLFRGVRCKRCAQRQPRRTSFGRRSAKGCVYASMPVSPLSGGGTRKLCGDSTPARPQGQAKELSQRRQPATPKAAWYPPGCSPAVQ